MSIGTFDTQLLDGTPILVSINSYQFIDGKEICDLTLSWENEVELSESERMAISDEDWEYLKEEASEYCEAYGLDQE